MSLDGGAEGSAAALLAALAAQRLLELAHARRNARRLAGAGATLHRDDGYGLIVATHVAWFAGIAATLALDQASVGWWTAVGAVLLLAGQALRLSAIRALGWRWNTRVWSVPGAPLVRSGPYRFVRHPNYAGVYLELVALPLAFGLWWAAAAAAVLHVPVLRRRIRKEERALGLRYSKGSSMNTGTDSGEPS